MTTSGDVVELQTIDTGRDILDPLFAGLVTHLTGGPGAGKSLLLLWYLGRRIITYNEHVLWVDTGGSFFPNRVTVLFGRDAPIVLSHILVAQVKSLPHMKGVAAELAAHGVPPHTDHLVIDPVSRWPRLALTRTAHSSGQAEFVAQDFFATVLEPLLFTAARDGFRVYLAHENSQDRPFWWDRYPARECRVHLQKSFQNPAAREISNAQERPVALLDLSRNPIRVFPPCNKVKYDSERNCKDRGRNGNGIN